MSTTLVRLADTLVVDVLDGLCVESGGLVTTSFGGFFAFRAALAAPERIRRIVECGWSPGARLGKVPLALQLGGSPPLGRLLSYLPMNDATARHPFHANIPPADAWSVPWVVPAAGFT